MIVAYNDMAPIATPHAARVVLLCNLLACSACGRPRVSLRLGWQRGHHVAPNSTTADQLWIKFAALQCSSMFLV
jgi:hypothetical protein